MLRQVPLLLGVLAIVLLTAVQASITGRFEDSNITEEQFAEMLKRVPKDIDDWHGTNEEVSEEVIKTAGARGYVSRQYDNTVTGDSVRIWLIVGHSRDVMRHTPDVCYPSSGFKTRSPDNARVPFEFEGQPASDFYTNTFVKEDASGRAIKRVFWAWYKPTDDGEVHWRAPKNVRFEIGNTPSLYKLYFSSDLHDFSETADQSPCMRFAEEFLPVVAKALSTTGLDTASGASDETSSDGSGESSGLFEAETDEEVSEAASDSPETP